MNELNLWFIQKYLANKAPNRVAETFNLAFQKKGYEFFTDRDYNVNLFGIRTSNKVVNTFDDIMVMAYKDGGEWIFNTFDITTTPGIHWMKNLLNPNGCAILVPGQYRQTWAIGYHNDYLALTQVRPVKVYRDKTLDEIYDMDTKTIDTGLFGINIHRSSPYGVTKFTDKYSAGCQVHADPAGFDLMMKVCTIAKGIWGNAFTYTLFDQTDFL